MKGVLVVILTVSRKFADSTTLNVRFVEVGFIDTVDALDQVCAVISEHPLVPPSDISHNH